MLVEVRPIARLRGKDPVDVTAALGPVLRALCAGDADLSRVRLVCDWVQYKHNFRAPVDVRDIAPDPRHNGDGRTEMEVAVDLRRPGADVTRALAAGDSDRVHLEEWGPGSRSCVWEFNALYWAHLRLWEDATGQGYESALPGGRSDATNPDGARELIRELFTIWDDLAARHALPEELYVVELGVGNGSQAATFLDTFREMDSGEGDRDRGYYRRLHYLMCDYSPHVLELARAAVASHAEHVSSFVLDAVHPTTALGFLRFKVFLVYVSNV
ncbi:MAG: hypothetical protein L0I24_23695, partial [Pseudonocardia sp.]|nr:hypothetical protein [Pseudonocardia sp.]